MNEAENVLRVLREAETAIEKEDIAALKELSNQTLHTASIYQDTENITVAVMIYSLSKILERKNYREYKQWPRFYKKLKICISRAVQALEKNQEDYFRSQLKCIREDINSLSGNFKKHIQDVFKKAQINKASRIYEHGISMHQTAKLLGITIWDLAEYAGQTGISDVNLSITLPVKIRIKNAMEIFEK